MCCRDDRNRVAGDVDTQFQTTRMDVGKMAADELIALVGDVQKDAVEAAFFHFEIDGTGDDVARRQFGTLVMFRHETGAVGKAQ
ncbi:hypothetical protein SDC9_174066 [bioreactor metagenome]|uniref:Uncharacterized protein n=1 Tax=bioreactor metagenome TaxID=1076179 RepID=A0A645GI41_9ZZZZ